MVEPRQCDNVLHKSCAVCRMAGHSGSRSHVGVAVCGARGAVNHKQLLQGKLQGPRQLLNLVPAHSMPWIMVLSAAQHP